MNKIPLDTLCRFFDELDETTLEPFDGTPNTHLPRDQQRTLRIKDIFKITHYKRVCRYNMDQLDICKSHFLTILVENMSYVAKCADIINKIKVITDWEMYESTAKNNMSLTGQQNNNSNIDTSQTAINTDEGKVGGFMGKADNTQLYTMLDETQRVIETKNILAKSENKLMDFIDPNIRQHEQSVTVEKSTSNQTNTARTHQSSIIASTSNRVTTYTRSTRAHNEIQALLSKIPRLRQEFCECFRPLFLC